MQGYWKIILDFQKSVGIIVLFYIVLSLVYTKLA
jgi:hypothetical protein